MDSITPLLISKALDGLSMRYLATAQNVANANTPNYQPIRVTFEERLRAAAAQGRAEIATVVPETELVPHSGREMRMDLEIATASQTAMRYGALLDLLGRRAQINRSAMGMGQ
jgi:flagellar basal-body rod protein FlgB